MAFPTKTYSAENRLHSGDSSPCSPRFLSSHLAIGLRIRQHPHHLFSLTTLPSRVNHKYYASYA